MLAFVVGANSKVDFGPGLVHMSVGHMSEAKSVATWACVDVACNLD